MACGIARRDGYAQSGAENLNGLAVPVIDHSLVLENLWVVAAISLGGGGFMGEIAGFLHGDLGCGPKVVIGASAALLIFGSIWFFAPAPTA